MMNIVFFASALKHFVAKTCASYISRCLDIQAYLQHEQRTNIRKVSLFQKLDHCLIVLRRRTSATPNARVAKGPIQAKPNRTTIQAVVYLRLFTFIYVYLTSLNGLFNKLVYLFNGSALVY